MTIDPPRPFPSLIKELKADLRLIFWEEGGEPAGDFLSRQDLARPTPKQIILALVGPEGGFSREEVEKNQLIGEEGGESLLECCRPEGGLLWHFTVRVGLALLRFYQFWTVSLVGFRDRHRFIHLRRSKSLRGSSVMTPFALSLRQRSISFSLLTVQTKNLRPLL